MCFCPNTDPGMPRCFNYAPTDNLEYLEWRIACKEKI
jgi:hypothetical protein